MSTPACILMVVDGHYPSAGGAEMQVRLLSSALRQQGLAVEIWAPRRDLALPRQDAVDGIPVQRIAYPHLKGLGALWLYLRFACMLLRHRGRYQAIHFNAATYFAAVGGLLRPWLPSPMVAKIAGADEITGGILDQALQQRPRIRLLNWAIRRLDHIQSLNPVVTELLLRTGYADAQIARIPNAVDLSKLQPPVARTPGPRLRVGFVGRLVPVKGLDTLLRAWQRVRAQHDAVLVIAGDGPQRAALQAQAQQLGLEDHVEFLGQVSNVGAVLASCDLYVQPSLQEGMPNSVLEAMACGLAVVATNNAGNLAVVVDGENGRVVPIGDEAALAHALTELLSDPDRRAAWGHAARLKVEREFGIPGVTAALRQKYTTARQA